MCGICSVNVRNDSTRHRYTLRGLVSQKSGVCEFDVRGVHIYFAKVQEFFHKIAIYRVPINFIKFRVFFVKLTFTKFRGLFYKIFIYKLRVYFSKA